jgi:hypothetical protein
LPPDPLYTYSARDCGDLGAVAAALAGEGGALAAAAEGFVRHAYRTLFVREADPGGLAYWAGTITGGADREAAALAILDSFARSTTESIASVGEPEFTRRLFRAALGRAPSAGELAAANGQSRSSQIVAILASYACRRHLRALGLRSTKLNQGYYVTGLFVMIARGEVAATAPEVEYWADQIYRGLQTAGGVAVAFVQSAECQASWGSLCASYPTDCNGWFVTEAYRALVHREPDPGGYAWWKAQLDAGTKTRLDLVSGLVGTAEFADRMSLLGI